MASEGRELPRGWLRARLGEIATFVAGKTPARDVPRFWEQRPTQGAPWVTISDMRPFRVIRDTSERISDTALADVFKGHLVPRGTLLMSFKLTIGRVATLGIDACHNEAIVAIYPAEGVDQEYLAFFLSQVDYGQYQDRAIKGNTLNREKLDRIEVLLPPLEEQRQLAALLSEVQRGIETEERLIAITRELKQAAMQQLFTRGSRGEEQKETEIGPVPASWNVVKLGTCCDVVSSSLSFTDFSALQDISTAETVRAMGVKVSDMNREGNSVRFTHSGIEKHVPRSVAERRLLPPDTIVFPKRGAAIATNKKRLTTAWTVLDPNLIGVRAGERLTTAYLFYWFQSFDLRSITEPGPTPQLNKKHLVPLSIPVPSDHGEQGEITAVLEAIDESLDVHERKRAALEQLFRALLNDLMTGRLRVGDSGEGLAA